jgi:hypothetical protein
MSKIFDIMSPEEKDKIKAFAQTLIAGRENAEISFSAPAPAEALESETTGTLKPESKTVRKLGGANTVCMHCSVVGGGGCEYCA